MKSKLQFLFFISFLLLLTNGCESILCTNPPTSPFYFVLKNANDSDIFKTDTFLKPENLEIFSLKNNQTNKLNLSFGKVSLKNDSIVMFIFGEFLPVSGNMDSFIIKCLPSINDTISFTTSTTGGKRCGYTTSVKDAFYKSNRLTLEDSLYAYKIVIQ